MAAHHLAADQVIAHAGSAQPESQIEIMTKMMDKLAAKNAITQAIDGHGGLNYPSMKPENVAAFHKLRDEGYFEGDYPLTVGNCLLYKKPKSKKEEVPVTVCIAAKCRDGVIFAASDRMITAGDIQFQPPSPKIHAFTRSIIIMTAGDSAFQTEIINEVHYLINLRVMEQPDNWWLVKDVVDLYVKYRNLAKLKRAESAILAPLGLDRDSYLEKMHFLSENIVDQITRDLINYDVPSIAAIITGIDTFGSHIYVVNDNNVSCYDSIGFASVGSGSRHAESQFMLAGHSYNSPLPETLLLTYSAKKRAEIAPGVGSETDMIMIGPALGYSDVLHPDAMKRIDKEYRKVVIAESKILAKARKEMNTYVEELKNSAVEKPQASPAAVGEEQSADATAVPEHA